MIVKLKFLKDGIATGREYSYLCNVDVIVGETVLIKENTLGIITEVNVPESEIEAFKDRIVTILGKYVPSEEPVIEESQQVEVVDLDKMELSVTIKDGRIISNIAEEKQLLSKLMEGYKTLPVNDKNKVDRKKDIATLRKIAKAFTERRQQVKAEYLNPYFDFDVEVNDLLKLIEEPITIINNQVKELEEIQWKQKCVDITAIFTELVGELADRITLEQIFVSQWDNQAYTLKKVREEMEAKIKDINLNATMLLLTDSDKSNVAVEQYYSDLNFPSAMGIITRYEQQKKDILRQKEEADARKAEADRTNEENRIRENERKRIADEERIRKEEQDKALAIRLAEEDRIRKEEQAKAEFEKKAAEFEQQQALEIKHQTEATVDAVYGITATTEELEQIELYFTSIGVEWERV